MILAHLQRFSVHASRGASSSLQRRRLFCLVVRLPAVAPDGWGLAEPAWREGASYPRRENRRTKVRY
jgi:hypothetical protein